MNSRGYFETVAPQWEQMRRDFFSDNLRDIALTEADIQPGRIAADIGAGSGFISRGLAARGAQVIAVDQSPAMLEQLRRHVPAADCRIGAAESLPLADGEVDYVFANMYLHHVPDPAVALREMARILRPGGKVVITDLDRHDHEFLQVEHHDRWMGFDRAKVAEWLTAAGLTEVKVTCAGQNCCACSQDGSDKAAVSIFLASAVKTTDQSQTDATAAGMSDEEDPVAVRSGALFASGMYCAESVLQAVAEAHGESHPLIPRIATGFCGGVSRTAGMCGALAGGIMALGMLTGRSTPEDRKDLCYALVYRLVGRFREQFGSTSCTDLLGCDLSTAEGARYFQESGLQHTVCARVTRQTAGLVEEVFARRGTIRHPLL
jgi:C_GCAxxG_C_C family probable redox protein